MPLEIHNYIWSGERLVQIESQFNHLNGVLKNMQDVLTSSNLDLEDIHSAHYEGESAKGRSSGYLDVCGV
jgi:hypothetical protein